MEFNLFEIICAAIGFFIVVMVLKKYAWGPVLATIDARQAEIAKSFDEIERKQAMTQSLLDEYSQKLRGIEADANEKLQEAVRKGQELAAQLRQEAELQRERILSKAQDEIAREKQLAKDELRKLTVELSFELTQKVLRTKLDEQEHNRLVRQFVDDLKEL